MEFESSVPTSRVRNANQGALCSDGQFVLYWMISARRPQYNFALQRAVEWAVELGKPLVVFEALRAGYPWASDRFHAFVIQGMADNQSAFSRHPVTYYPYLEREHGQGRGLLAAFAERACLVVADDFPCFFLPRMVASAAQQVACRFECVDGNGLFPVRSTDRQFLRAVDFRRFLQKNLMPHLAEVPAADPLDSLELPPLQALDEAIEKKWPRSDVVKLAKNLNGLSRFEIDHSVGVSPVRGGMQSAQTCLDRFLTDNLSLYGDSRNHPDHDGASGFSSFLHFGHLSSHDIFERVCRMENWTPDRVADRATGSSSGWWNMSESSERFLDQLITWRELGYNMCTLRDDYDQFESLPDWAQQTLEDHAADPRPYLYDLEQLETAATHDRLWNAAQWQLVTTGKMHNYLRMLWGKKILKWTPSPRVALEIMLELNNKYALDGRNPNSYSGIFWVLGRYDRPWGPERPVFGKIRYMTSQNTARKLKVKRYIEQFTPDS